MSSPASVPARTPRKFLVVIDKTPECAVALRFATRRAQHTGGRVTLMCAATLPDFQQWRGVEEIMRDEAHAEAEALLHEAAKTVNELAGILPELVIPYGAGHRLPCPAAEGRPGYLDPGAGLGHRQGRPGPAGLHVRGGGAGDSRDDCSGQFHRRTN